MNGTIFNIQRFSLHDGYGMRTTVFLKGCPLRCVWCHNPESKNAKPQLSFFESKCVGCKTCEAVCENGAHYSVNGKKTVDFDKCAVCEKCTNACPTGALEILGKNVTVEEVLDEVKRDMPFYNNMGGGMTLSGGEPMMQPEFSEELLSEAKKLGIHTAVETSGCVEFSVFEKLIPHLDMILFDIKQMDSEMHKEFTGQGNERIHENLKRLCSNEYSVEIVVRTPVIPGYNDGKENFHKIADFLLTLERVPRVEVLPYNPLAGSKHPRIGTVYELDTDESKGNSPDSLCDILKERGITAKVLR